MMNYGQKKIPIGIWLGALGPNLLFHSLLADWLANAVFPRNHLQSPVVLLGLALFTAGFIINRMADWKQSAWKKKLKDHEGYTFPSGWLFNFIANPNYFGEFVEWTGFLVGFLS
jgi:steroid 5-alpha reductase family enzyme